MYYFIDTYGCQMNEYDSQLVEYEFIKAGFEKAASPQEADVVIYNTCTVRKSAEERIFGQLGHIKNAKKKRNIIVGVIGCMAQRMGDEILNNFPQVNFVLGTDFLDEIVSTVSYIKEHPRERIATTTLESKFLEFNDIKKLNPQLSEFVAITRGCDNFCTYCIVPYVRGRERSRDYKKILDEIKYLVEHGTKEITLLGQNVNSYKYEDVDFLKLITMVSEINNLKRVRYTTSHPKDMTPEIVNELLQNPKICNHFHLPLQSGSNEVLKKMNRKYTIEHYKSLIEEIRKKAPLASITTDIIVGFMDETDEDFEKTAEMMRFAEYDSAFIFKYNPRPGTRGYTLPDNVAPEIKQKRLTILNKIADETALKRNKMLIGKTKEILVTTKGRNGKNQYKGRTEENKIVVFDSDKDLIGKFVNVKIEEVTSRTLFAKLI